MRRIAALALLLLAPTAAACDYVIPERFSHVVWTDGERVLTDQDGKFGYYLWSTRAFEPVADPFDLMAPRASPDGTWLVWLESPGTGADCSPSGGRLLALRVGESAPFVVHEGAVRAFDVSDRHVAFMALGAREVTIAPLATRESARTFGVAHDYAALLRVSHDARYVTVWMPLVDRLIVYDATNGKIAHEIEQTGDVQGVAFSPDARRVATLTGTYGVDATLRVHELPSGTVLAERVLMGETGSALVWSASGIAVASHTITYPGDGNVRNDATVRIFGAPSTLGRENATAFPGARIDSMAATTGGDLALAAGSQLHRVEAEAAQEEPAPPTGPNGPTTASPTLTQPVPASGALLALVATIGAAAIAARSSFGRVTFGDRAFGPRVLSWPRRVSVARPRARRRS